MLLRKFRENKSDHGGWDILSSVRDNALNEHLDPPFDYNGIHINIQVLEFYQVSLKSCDIHQ